MKIAIPAPDVIARISKNKCAGLKARACRPYPVEGA